MTTRDGRYTISYNGEVYNYLDLRAELEPLGHTFETDSDTEVVLEAFAEWGADAFDRFNGMFGLAIWDAQERSLTLARDHFGIKPLYVCRSAGSGAGGADAWVFASEIKPHPGVGAVREAAERPDDLPLPALPDPRGRARRRSSTASSGSSPAR